MLISIPSSLRIPSSRKTQRPPANTKLKLRILATAPEYTSQSIAMLAGIPH